jgi:integrase
MGKSRLAEGIFEDNSGIAIRVSVRGTPREFRKDEKGERYKDKGWTVDQLKTERKRIDAREHLKAKADIAKAHSLAADVKTYLQALSGRTKEDAQNLLEHWTVTFGDRARASLTAIELRQHAATWMVPAVRDTKGHTLRPEQPVSASTFNHRRQALISLYKALDGPQALNPAREIPKRKEQLGAPRALSYAVIEAAFKKMPESQSRARLKLMAYTGLPQMQIEKLTPADWQEDRLRVTPRRKGSGAAGRWIPLSLDAKAALKEFSRLACWGPFSRSSLHKAWKAVGPKGSNPYSLRHSWITELYRRSNGDVIAVQQLSLHSRLDQTSRYAAAALEDRMAALVLPRILTTTEPDTHSNSFQSVPPTGKSKKVKTRGRKRSKSRKTGHK